MDDKERTALIRKGNEAFNSGNIHLASEIFKSTDYKDGLIRVGDYFYYDKHQPLMAYGYYRRANYKKMLNKLSDSFIFALKCWLAPEPGDKTPDKTVKEQTVKRLKEIPGIDFKED